MNATARQKMIISRLCMALRIRDPLEEMPMSVGEAGELIRRLIAMKREQEFVKGWKLRC